MQSRGSNNRLSGMCKSRHHGDSLDRGIDSENKQINDFLILDNHVEASEENPNKTRVFFAYAADKLNSMLKSMTMFICPGNLACRSFGQALCLCWVYESTQSILRAELSVLVFDLVCFKIQRSQYKTVVCRRLFYNVVVLQLIDVCLT
ncbi:hypothetical protein L1049_014200 [Liquidambar formosana]|uniref:Uncharacterized protein n=1 Tax=Liquidambar formosana TaxID=63359 RepID=A0AAP0WZG0_LIQFO